MDNKLLVFVVLATLGHSDFARHSTSSSSYVLILSEEDRGVLSKLRAVHDAAISVACEVNVSLYDYIKKLMFRYLSNLPRTTSDDNEAAAIFAELKRMDKMRFTYMLDAIPIALKNRCDHLESTRATIHANLNDTYLSILPEIRLAQNGRYSEKKESSLVASAVGLVGGFYDLIRHCGKITDSDTLAAIEIAEHRSFTGIYHEAASVADLLKFFAATVASRKKNETLISHKVDAALSTGLAGARADTDNKRAILEALYYNSILKRSGIIHCLFLNRYAAIVTTAKYKESIGIIFEELFHRLYCNGSQLLKESKGISSRTDIAEAKTAAVYVHGTDALIEAILCLCVRDSGGVRHLQEVENALTDKIAANIFKMVKSAVDTDKRYSHIIAKIHILESKTAHLCEKFVKNLLDVISGGKDSSEKNENEFKIIEKNTVRAVDNYVRCVRDGTVTAVNAVHKNETTCRDDISALEDFEKRGKIAAGNNVESLTDAILLALLDNYES